MISFTPNWTNFKGDSGTASQACAWGEATLSINNYPVWFAGSFESPTPITWNWIELLEYLGSTWTYLVTEQAYPLNLVAEKPSSLRQSLEKYWNSEGLDDLRREDDDERVYQFEDRHDLSRGMAGIKLPSIMLVREGDCMWIDTGVESTSSRSPLSSVLSALEQIGDTIAERVSAQKSVPRTRKALECWAQRNNAKKDVLLSLATGLSPKRLPANQQSLKFWELEDAVGADSELASVARFALAARTTRGYSVTDTDRDNILKTVRERPYRNTTHLDETAKFLTDQTSKYGEDSVPPWEQGYELARKLRTLKQLDAWVDPEAMLKDWGVEIVEVHLSLEVEAIGCWGHKHGPAILINTKGKRSRTTWGRRATMAHELCHLLCDRKRSLPHAEVLGGRSPLNAERRANAFAAEFLAPASAVYAEHVKTRKAEKTLVAVMEKFGVGQVLAANQLKIWHSKLVESDQRYLESIVNKAEEAETYDAFWW